MLRGAILAAIGLVLLVGRPEPTRAQPSETAVKAAFLPRFARYVTWPPHAVPRGNDPVVLCAIGRNTLGNALDQTARGQAVDGRRMVVRHLASTAGAGGCHIAFVAGDEAHPTGQILAGLARLPVLTVTDARSGAQRGVIHFTIVGGRVRFFIDNVAASQRGLTVSSRLLALAVGVRQK